MRQIHELQPNLFALDVVLQGYSVRSIIGIGQRYAAVWDTLVRPDDMAALGTLLGDKPFHVIYSHADWDHIWGTEGFAATPLNISAHAECLRRFGSDVPRTLLEKQEEEPGKWDDVKLHAPEITFESRLAFDLGGINLELHHLPGHTSDCIVGWLPQWGVLLGGDAIESPLPVVNEARLVSRWLRALEDWAANSDVWLAIPSHGKIEGRQCLDTTIDYLRRLQNGDEIDLPTDLEHFYRETHQNNLQLVKSYTVPDG